VGTLADLAIGDDPHVGPATIKLPPTSWAVLLDGQPQKLEPDPTTVTVEADSHWLLSDR
jgi:hypothetical protein